MSHASHLDNDCTGTHSKIKILLDRASMLREARIFFYRQGIVEVDCPILSQSAPIDAHIDLITAFYENKEKRYLHSSPEFGMKRLLAEGMGDIFQLSHVFRDGEWGAKHNPEFMMAEWYRLGFNLEQMIDDTVEFISLFLGKIPYEIVHYRDLFQQLAGIDYIHASEEELVQYIKNQNIPLYPTAVQEGKDALLNLILGSTIEPLLGRDKLTILAYYPASQSALARKRWIGEEEVAERFEVYFQGIELANGYHELTDAHEQRLRFHAVNAQREKLGKEKLPLDEHFLQALGKGIPTCCGVAVGFDRLMMLRLEQTCLETVLSFGWGSA